MKGSSMDLQQQKLFGSYRRCEQSNICIGIYNSRNCLGHIDRRCSSRKDIVDLQQQKLFGSYRHEDGSHNEYYYLQQQKLFGSYRLHRDGIRPIDLQQQKLFGSYRPQMSNNGTITIYNSRNCLGHIDYSGFCSLSPIYNSRNCLGHID